MSEHLSSRLLDLRALGALSTDEAARVEQHLAACARCRGDAETLDAARVRFDARVLPRTLPVVRARVEGRWRRWLWLAAPALALAAILLIVVPRGIATSPDDDLRIKGGAALQIVARQGERVAPVDAATRLAPGDAIRFVVTPAGARHLLVASVDGAGAVTIYHPYGGDRSAPLPALPRVELPGSIVLDDAPGPERVFALFSAEPIAAAGVRAALAAVAAGGPAAIRATERLPSIAAEQSSVLIEKTR